MSKFNSFERRFVKAFAFRNLHQPGVVWSVRDGNGRTILHSENILIKNAKFVVQKGGQALVRRTRRKEIHAGVRGELVVDPVEARTMVDRIQNPHTGCCRAYYNPYANDTFVDAAGEPVTDAECVLLTKGNDGKSQVLFLKVVP